MKVALGAAVGAWLLAGAALAQTDAGIPPPPEAAPQDAGTPLPVAPGQPNVGAPAEADAGTPVPVAPGQPEAGAIPPAPPQPPAPPKKRRHRGPDRSMNAISANLVRPFFKE